MIGYSAVLLVLVSILGGLIFGRSEVETTVLRVPGQLFQVNEDRVTNLYNAQFINKTNNDMVLDLRVTEIETAAIRLVGADDRVIAVPAGGFAEIVFFIDLPKSALTGSKTSLKLEVTKGEEVMDIVKTNFLGPVK
jgi:hypothetical protein